MQTRSLLVVLQGALALAGAIDKRAIQTIDFEAPEICTGTCAAGAISQPIPDGYFGFQWSGFRAGRQLSLAQIVVPPGGGLAIVADRTGSSFQVPAGGAPIDPISIRIACSLSTGTAVSPALSGTIRVRPSDGIRVFIPAFQDCFFRVPNDVSIERESFQLCTLPVTWRNVRNVTVSLQAASIPTIEVLAQLGLVTGELGLPPNIGQATALIDSVVFNQ